MASERLSNEKALYLKDSYQSGDNVWKDQSGDERLATNENKTRDWHILYIIEEPEGIKWII